MSSPLDMPATHLDILTTRAMITALGHALVKKGVVSNTDVATELSAIIQAMDEARSPLLLAELKLILGTIQGWGT